MAKYEDKGIYKSKQLKGAEKAEDLALMLLDYYKDARNLPKTVKEACEELGISYVAMKHAIESYGLLRFHTELYRIRSHILAELSARCVGEVAKRFEKPKNDREFWKAQAELREWHKVLVGTVQRIEQRLEGRIEHEHSVYIQFLREARERLAELATMASTAQSS